MFCPYCGHSNPAGSAHCCQCGAALTQSAPNQQGNYGQPNYNQPNYNQPNYNQPNYNQPNYNQPSYAAAQPEVAKPENVVAGSLAALVGTAIGTLAIILLLQANIIASIAGFLMAFCALKGYEKFGGKLSTTGIVISIVMMLIATYVGYRVGFVWAFMSEYPYNVTYSQAADLIDYAIEMSSDVSSEYTSDLVMLYMFVALGSAGTIASAFKKNKKKA